MQRPSQGHPSHIDLREALELSALVAVTNRDRGQRFCVRWLQRRLAEAPEPPTTDEAAMVAGCPAALGGAGHHEALASLRAMAERATGRLARRV